MLLAEQIKLLKELEDRHKRQRILCWQAVQVLCRDQLKKLDIEDRVRIEQTIKNATSPTKLIKLTK